MGAFLKYKAFICEYVLGSFAERKFYDVVCDCKPQRIINKYAKKTK